MRIFIALNLPEDVRKRLAAAQDSLKRGSSGGRFPREDSMHITLEFLGELSRSETDRLIHCLENFQFSSFTLQLNGLGSFRGGRGRTWWAGLSESQPLRSLQSDLHQLLEEQGFQLEDRPFRPHITLGRNILLNHGSDGGSLSDCLDPVVFSVTALDIMHSQIGAGPPVYSVLHRVSGRDDS